MPGLPLTSPHDVTCTIIRGRVLGSQAVHLQVELVLGVVSGDGELALHRVAIVCTTYIRIYATNPLQPPPWSLADPVHPVGTEGESSGCA